MSTHLYPFTFYYFFSFFFILVTETPSVRSHAPPHPIHPDLPLDVPHKLVGCGSAAALG